VTALATARADAVGVAVVDTGEGITAGDPPRALTASGVPGGLVHAAIGRREGQGWVSPSPEAW